MRSRQKTIAAWIARLKNLAEADHLRQHEDKVLLVLTLVIGALVGLAVVAFILVTENLGARMYPAGSAAWRRVGIPVLGALITGFLLKRYFPYARGSGIPQTKTALFIHEGNIRFRTAVGKFFCSSISLASGIALGREGPSVQVGAGIASSLGRRLGLSQSRIKALVPVGASAALSAAFNTPIAAVLFCLEEVLGDLHAPVLGSIVLSAATSWMVLHMILGDEPLFHVPAYQLIHPAEFGVYALLGILGGLASVFFVKLLLWIRGRFLRMPAWTEWFQPVAGALTVGLMGWFVPDVLGVGYGFVSEALNGKIALSVMALLVLLKIVATASCYGSGNAGGIFGPSLFIGAMLGGAVGSGAHQLLPDYTGGVGAYALVGMGAAFAGIIRLPMTSVIMIFEVTRDYSIIVPLMISNLISFFISNRLQRVPIYDALLHQDGIHLPGGGGQREMLLVANAMQPATETLPADGKVSDHVPPEEIDEKKAWPVVGARGILGMISAAELRKAVEKGESGRTLHEVLSVPAPATRLAAEGFPHVYSDHPLDKALQRMAKSGLHDLPVVSRANPREMKGLLSLDNIMDAYGLGKGEIRPAEPVRREGSAPGAVLAGVVAATLGVVILAGFLTYYYRVERRSRADNYFQSGNQLAELGRREEAIQRYRNALSISHSSEHRLALALALLETGRQNESAIYFRELLQEDPHSGIANLGMARAADAQGRAQVAVTHYRRAVYGNWADEPLEHRIQARFELSDLLTRIGSRKQAVTELLALAEDASGNTAAKKRVGQLLLDQGAPKEAADVYREILRRDPEDAGALGGLGEAEFATERYPEARQAFRSALRLNLDNAAVRKRLEVTEEILTLDPTLRRLDSAERYRRSQRLLEGVHGVVEQCAAVDEQTAAPPSPVRQLLDDASKRFSSKRRPRSYGEAADGNIELAEELWKARERLCDASSVVEEPLAHVMSRLTR